MLNKNCEKSNGNTDEWKIWPLGCCRKRCNPIVLCQFKKSNAVIHNALPLTLSSLLSLTGTYGALQCSAQTFPCLPNRVVSIGKPIQTSINLISFSLSLSSKLIVLSFHFSLCFSLDVGFLTLFLVFVVAAVVKE